MIKHFTSTLTYTIKVGLVYLLVIYSVKTLSRNRDWHSEFTLYYSAVHTVPHNGKMLHNLAAKYAAETDSYSAAIAETLMRTAIEVEPNYIAAYSDLGVLLTKQENLDEAERVSVNLC